MADNSRLAALLAKIDSYTGAPTRAAIAAGGKLYRGDDPIGGISDVTSAFKNQFGEDPSLAPSQSDLAKKLGFSDKPLQSEAGRLAMGEGLLSMVPGGPIAQTALALSAPKLREAAQNVSPADIAGVPIGMAADYTNAVPISRLAESIAKMGPLLKGAKAGEELGLTTKEAGLLSKGFEATDPQTFVQSKSQNKRLSFLSASTADDLKNHKLFMTKNGTGYALSPEDDLQQVFNNSGVRGAGEDAVTHAITNGAKTLDAFDGHLPNYYNNFGFNLTDRVKWDDKYAPKGWDYEKYGRPDIVFMQYPENLSRDADAITARLGIARAEKSARTSGTRGSRPDLTISPEHQLIDWSTWRDMDHNSPQTSSRSTPLSSESLKIPYQGLMQQPRSQIDLSQ